MYSFYDIWLFRKCDLGLTCISAYPPISWNVDDDSPYICTHKGHDQCFIPQEIRVGSHNGFCIDLKGPFRVDPVVHHDTQCAVSDQGLIGGCYGNIICKLEDREQKVVVIDERRLAHLCEIWSHVWLSCRVDDRYTLGPGVCQMLPEAISKTLTSDACEDAIHIVNKSMHALGHVDKVLGVAFNPGDQMQEIDSRGLVFGQIVTDFPCQSEIPWNTDKALVPDKHVDTVDLVPPIATRFDLMVQEITCMSVVMVIAKFAHL